MKIIYVINSLNRGGSEKQLYLLIKHFRKKFDIILIVLKSGGGFENEFRTLNIPIIYVKHNSFSFSVDYIYSIYKILTVVKKEKPAIIHSWLFKSNLISAIIKFINPKLKLIVSERNTFFWCKKRHFLMNRLIYSLSNAILVNSYKLKDEIINVFPRASGKIKVIYNGIDLNVSVGNIPDVLILIKKKNEGCIIIGYVARFASQKRHIDIIEAIPFLIKKYHNLCFVFVGEGPMLTSCKQKVSDYGLNDYVLFISNIDNPLSYIKYFDIMLHPSEAEGMPNAIMEGMLLGKPIIATNVGGISELIIDGKNGILIPPRRTDKIIEALMILLDDINLRYKFSCNNIERIKGFSTTNMLSSFDKLYKSLIKI